MTRKKKAAARKVIKGWCTKFALTRGIHPVEVCVIREPDQNRWGKTYGCYCTIVEDPRAPVDFLDGGIDFFTKRAEAEERARKMAESAILVLQERIAKLQLLHRRPRVVPNNPRRSHWRTV